MENNQEYAATFHEFGNTIQYSLPASVDVKRAARLSLEHSFQDLIKFTPDKVWREEPRFFEMPIVDRLQRFNGMAYRMVFASPIYDYFERVKKDALIVQERRIKAQLRTQSRKNWWTRLCWFLGGFDVE